MPTDFIAHHHPLTDVEILEDGRLRISARTASGQAIDSAWIRYELDNEEYLTALEPAESSAGAQCWRVEIPTNPGAATTYYLFKFICAKRQFCLDAGGVHSRIRSRSFHFKHVQGLQTPQWVWDQVFYQIFPDRFRIGDDVFASISQEPDEDKEQTPLSDWDAIPDPSRGSSEFFGGDLNGVTDALPYLHDELGVSAIYLNPIFASHSNHRYDTDDYSQVEPRLGGEPALLRLREETRARDMRLILDAVVNHTSVHHSWFQQAQAGNEQYRAFYNFNSEGRYAAWKGFESLPKLNYANPEVAAAMYSGDNAILRHWLRPPYAVDGWRLDAVHMLGEGPSAHNNATHMRGMRECVKQEAPQTYLLGEHFFEATEWLQGDQEDGAMNYYGFAHPLRAWLAGLDISGHPGAIDGREFAAWLAEARAAVPCPIQLSQLNLLDTHDTPRFLTLLQGDRDLYKLALGLLFTYSGAPCLYYGDEIGLPGGGDPDCRRPFPWDRERWDIDILNWCKTLIALRKSTPALCRGGHIDLWADTDCYCFARTAKEGSVIIAANRGDAATALLDTRLLGAPGGYWRDLLSGDIFTTDEHTLALSLPSKSVLILLPE
ncbi:maltodextrin glucosidase [Hahella sp. KA22]|uniref:maltodextrin glucosidase n=1 Tax=Hahella sp. KA22 TaxID=1628392 RepID=UPI000FDF53E4|nr:maltodextrin glucosidase [Hahella sp. KA22]AZZ91965.1 maltodextrin glucosidase [Hahella sp. KA22]QAY55336.1 maltodextrin glucosidase [Hahella sp. KA22]